jgi:hypothetical protein
LIHESSSLSEFIPLKTRWRNCADSAPLANHPLSLGHDPELTVAEMNAVPGHSVIFFSSFAAVTSCPVGWRFAFQNVPSSHSKVLLNLPIIARDLLRIHECASPLKPPGISGHDTITPLSASNWQIYIPRITAEYQHRPRPTIAFKSFRAKPIVSVAPVRQFISF